MQTSSQLREGNIYTRNDLQRLFNITDATINNGIFKPSGHQSIWLFVTEQKTKDMPQLYDQIIGDTLYWDGQPKGGTDKLVIEHEAHGLELLVFYRKNKREFPGAGFRYEGVFCYSSHSHTDDQPTKFVLKRHSKFLAVAEKDIEALQIEETYREGEITSVLVNKHERNPKLRAAAIDIHGTRCQVCGFSFAKTYGSHGDDFIEVHHLKPVSAYIGATDVDPSEDMATLCANCHRMIHRNPKQPLSLDDLRQIVNAKRSQ